MVACDAILRHAGERLAHAVAVYAGTGNNGGDAWVVAGRLRSAGVAVRVHSTGDPTTDDARAARARACEAGAFDAPLGTELVAVDGLLGTGSTGSPRGRIAEALPGLRGLHARGAMLVALDVPTGMDASTGDAADEIVPADVTVTFGTLKRGLLVARHLTGLIEVADIGLGRAAALDDGAPQLLDSAAVQASIPTISAVAHKGTRGRIAIIGGSSGMAGAVVYACRGALRSGTGLPRAVVDHASLSAVQAAVPAATAAVWPAAARDVPYALGAPDALVIGPGIGSGSRSLVTMVLGETDAPVVLDADALNAFAGDTHALRNALRARRAILTPHPAECARLLSTDVATVLRERFEIGRTLADATGATVVLKGTPTVIAAADGRMNVAPVGSPVLAAGGSGDVLAGIAGALFPAMQDPFDTACAAVWAHGTAAERVGTKRIRGAMLDDVVDALRDVWHVPLPVLPASVLAVLPDVGERAPVAT
jgi:hydroxyethylthiazole kinase-like uncharacterized protein yjeF